MKQKACFLLAVWLCAIPAIAQRGSTERELQQKLRKRLSVTWQGQQLRKTLDGLANTQKLSIWLDRRVDPQQIVSLQLRSLTLHQILEKLGKQQKLGVIQLSSVVYIGPQQSAQELPALARQARSALAKTPAAMKRRWLKTESTEFPDLCEPRSLLSELLSSAEVELNGEEKIPHDLWRARELPPLALVDRVVLVLVGFDLTCQISRDGKSCSVVPIKHSVIPGRSLAAIPLPSSPRPQATEQVYSLKLLNQPLGNVVDQLARQLQLQVIWDEELSASQRSVQNRLVSCDVQNADLDELLTSILEPAGLRHQRDGQVLKIETLKTALPQKKRSSP